MTLRASRAYRLTGDQTAMGTPGIVNQMTQNGNLDADSCSTLCHHCIRCADTYTGTRNSGHQVAWHRLSELTITNSRLLLYHLRCSSSHQAARLHIHAIAASLRAIEPVAAAASLTRRLRGRSTLRTSRQATTSHSRVIGRLGECFGLQVDTHCPSCFVLSNLKYHPCALAFEMSSMLVYRTEHSALFRHFYCAPRARPRIRAGVRTTEP